MKGPLPLDALDEKILDLLQDGAASRTEIASRFREPVMVIDRHLTLLGAQGLIVCKRGVKTRDGHGVAKYVWQHARTKRLTP